MSKLQLEQPQRQAPVGVAVLFFQNLRRGANFFLAVIVVNFGTSFQMLGLSIYHWGGLVALFFGFLSYSQYRRFRFWVQQDNFIIEQGVLRREKLSVAFDRIQTVNTRQNLIHRLIGVTALSIDTAGSQQQEIEISALGKDYALALRRYLLERKREALQAKNPSAEAGTLPEEESGLSEDLKSRKALVALNLKDVLWVGLTQNHLRTGLVVFALINSYLWQFEEFLLGPFEKYIEAAGNQILAQWVFLLPFALLGFVLVSVIISLIFSVLRFYGLKLYLNDESLLLESGLLSRVSYHLPFGKIQYLKWSSNPLRALIGYRSLVIKQAGAQELADQKAVRVPGVQSRVLLHLLAELYPERQSGPGAVYRAHHLLFIQLLLWLGLVPALLLSVLFWWQEFPWYYFLPLALYLPLVAFLALRYYQSVQMRIRPEYLVLRKGWAFPTRYCLPLYKLQNLSLERSIFQKRRGLASLHFYTAAGNFSMPHLPESEARALLDFLLERIESSGKKWM